MLNRNLKQAIEDQNLEKLKKIAEDVKLLIDSSDELTLEEIKILKNYSKESKEFARKVFDDKSTCEVIDGDFTNTVPYQVGLIKGYCGIILQK